MQERSAGTTSGGEKSKGGATWTALDKKKPEDQLHQRVGASSTSSGHGDIASGESSGAQQRKLLRGGAKDAAVGRGEYSLWLLCAAMILACLGKLMMN